MRGGRRQALMNVSNCGFGMVRTGAMERHTKRPEQPSLSPQKETLFCLPVRTAPSTCWNLPAHYGEKSLMLTGVTPKEALPSALSPFRREATFGLRPVVTGRCGSGCRMVQLG